MNEIKIFNNEEFGKIRTTILEEPWFVGKDICSVFGDCNYRRSLQRVDEEDKKILPMQTQGGMQNMTCVNESGLYSLIFGMRPKKARGVTQNDNLINERVEKLRRFKHWITAEVLPEIRKTGTYGIHLPDGSLNLDLLEEMIHKGRELQNQIKEQRLLLNVQNQQIQELTPKASYYDVVLNCKDLISVTEFAKDYGWSARRMNETLKNLGIQYRQGKHWFLYQKYADKGYTSTKTHVYLKNNGNEGCNIHTYWTQKGRLFVYDLLKDKNILPLIERETI